MSRASNLDGKDDDFLNPAVLLAEPAWAPPGGALVAFIEAVAYSNSALYSARPLGVWRPNGRQALGGNARALLPTRL